MTRRSMTLGLAAAPVAAHASPSDDPQAWLAPTRYVDFQHPAVVVMARDATRGIGDPTGKALALFAAVKNRIRFGFAPGFWDNCASDVIRHGRGFCNTKSTLFVALLRAEGIPARQVFVDIDTQVLNGLINPGTQFVDHSYVEVWLDGAWRATDAYIVDDALFGPAQARLRQSGSLLGWGVHATGTNQWDGRQPAFAQWNTTDPRPIHTRHHGPFADVAAFYRDVPDAWNRLNPVIRTGMGLLAAQANATADRMRAAG